MHPAISALDNAITQCGRAETLTLRRIVGNGANTINIDVDCLAIIDALTEQQIVSGINATDLNVIMSATQINARQWPGGTVPLAPRLNVDPRVPRINDKAILRGKVRNIQFVDPLFGGDGGKEILRINMRVAG